MKDNTYYTIQIKTRDSNTWNAFNINTTEDVTSKPVKEATKEKVIKLMNRLKRELGSSGCLFRIQEGVNLL
jgi:hypothetical protein